MKTSFSLLLLLLFLGFSMIAKAQVYTMSSSGVYTTCSGKFYDGGGIASDYPNNQDVVVTFKPASVGSKISVTFDSLHTETQYDDCGTGQYLDDILYVYNGKDTTATLIGTINGFAYGTITSTDTSGSLTFKFVSHCPEFAAPANSRSGWSATISCNTGTAPSDITMIASGTFTTCGGKFYDGGGPQGNYMNNQDVVVTLKPATVGSKISVAFDSLHTETQYDNCANGQYLDDILYVYNGKDTTATLIGTINGFAYGTITSTDASGSLTFKFVSHCPEFAPPANSRSGWSATISCNTGTAPNDITMIASGTFTTCGGKFYDGGGPQGNYMNNQDVVVTLKPGTVGSKISVAFDSLHTETQYDNCANGQYLDDILYVYNGKDTTARLIGTISGFAYGTITSTDTSGSLTFKFVSHCPEFAPPINSRSGWSATISCNTGIPPNDITMIASGTFTTCGGKFYDGGGPQGNYMNNQDVVLTLKPNCIYNKVSVTFDSLHTETNYDNCSNGQYYDDILYIYDGTDTSVTPKATLSGAINPGTVISTSNDGSLTFKFISYCPEFAPPVNSRSGWSGTISCICTASIGGTASASPTSVCPNGTSTITVTGFTGCTIQWQSSPNNVTFTDISGANSAQYTTPSLSSTTYYRARVYNAGSCSSTNSTVATVTINTLSVAASSISATSNPICANTSTTLNPVGGALGTGASWHWYSGSCGGTPVASGTVTPTVTTTYYVRAEGTCDTTICKSLIITVNPLPAAPTSGGNITVCQNATPSTLSATPPNGSKVDWYNVSSGGSPLQSSSNTYSTSTAVNYYAESRDSITGCKSSSRTLITFTVNQNPAAPTSGGNVTVCQNSTPATLTATPPNGSTIDWYDANSGGNLLKSGSNTDTASIAGNYYAESRNTTSGCKSTSRTLVTLTVNPNPVAPTSGGNVTVCQDATPATLNATPPNGSKVDWYNVSSGGSPLLSGSNTYPSSTAGNYYAESKNTVTGCTSTNRTLVSLTINQPPQVILSSNSPLCDSSKLDLSSNYVAGATYSWSGPAFTSLNQNDSIIVATVADSGWYHCTITGSNACSKTDSVLVDITKNPPVYITPNGPTTFCFGGNVILTASSLPTATDYSWNTGKTTQSIMVDTTGYYFCTVHACGVNIPTSSMLVTSDDPTVTINQNVLTLTPTINNGSSPYRYLWTPGNATTSTITVSVNGTYSVTIKDADSCSASGSINVVNVGIKEYSNVGFFNVYPNPNNGIFNLEMRANKNENLSIKVIDVLGKVIYMREEINKGQFEIDLRNAAKGIYLVQVNDGLNIYTHKLIIQ